MDTLMDKGGQGLGIDLRQRQMKAASSIYNL